MEKPKNREDARNAKCANCLEKDLPASYRGCKKCPQSRGKAPRGTAAQAKSQDARNPAPRPQPKAQSAQTAAQKAPVQQTAGLNKELKDEILAFLGPAIQEFLDKKFKN